MKNTIYWVAIILFCLPTHTAFANIPSSVELNCTHYEMTVRNTFPYTLKISATKGKDAIVPATFFAANQTMSFDGRFTKNNLQKTKIVCVYDESTYQIDFKANNQKLEADTNQLRKNKDDAISQSQLDLGVKLAAQTASTATTSSNDGPIASLFKWISRIGGRATKFVYTLKEEFKSIQKKQYNSYLELLIDLKKKNKTEKDIEDLSKILSKHLNIKEKTSEYGINAVLYYLEESQEIEVRYEDTKKLLIEQHDKVDAEIKACKADDSFETNHTYINAYAIANKPMDLRPFTPNFTVSIEPFIIGNNLNEFWTSDSDKLLTDKDGDNKLEGSDGLWNKSLGGSIGFVVSPEMRLGSDSYAKLYANVGYHQFGYYLDTTYKLSRNFFATIPSSAKTFNVSEPIQFQQNNTSFGITARFFVKKRLIIDLNGGYMKQSGTLNLYQSKLTSGHTWVSEQIKTVEDSYTPFGGLKIGYGYNHKHSGTHFSVGIDFYSTSQMNTTAYKITESKTDKPIGFGTNGLHYKIYFGLTTAF
jgi:hypothetical protein